MTSTQVVETSVTTKNSPSQDYTKLNNQSTKNNYFFVSFLAFSWKGPLGDAFVLVSQVRNRKQ